MEFMNEHARRSLDIEYIFTRISPKTPYGIQKKREIKPFKIGEEAALNRELDETEKLLILIKSHQEEFKILSKKLCEIKEIRLSLKRATEEVVLDEIELFEIKNFLFDIKEILEIEEKIKNISEALLLFRCEEIEELLDPEKQRMRTFYLYDSYSDKLSSIRQQKRELQRQYDVERKRITSLVEELLGTKLKLSGEVLILKKDEDKLEKARKCPYLAEGAATMLQVTFKIKNDEGINKLAEYIEEIKQAESSEEYHIRKYLSFKISEKAEIMKCLIEKLSTLDFFMARAEFAISIGGIRPILHCHDKIFIKNGRHIKLDEVLKAKGKAFCPISFSISRGVTIITGANMGGKTVNLKLAGMLSAMAQYGLFVPAEEFQTCLFDYIYFSIGDMQSIDSGLSTFGSEISGMIEILKYSSFKGLVLIDELARGTNPEEGYAISRAIVKYLKDSSATTLFTTHFDGITTETGIRHLRVKGLKSLDFEKLRVNAAERLKGVEAVLENMDYSLEEVESNYEVPRDAINIARLMGLDEKIINYSEKILEDRKERNNGKA